MSTIGKSWKARLILLGLPVAVLALAALLVWGPGSSKPASAHSPHAGLDLSVGVGAGCDSSAGPTTCTFDQNATFTLDFKVRTLPADLSYAGYDVKFTYAGVTPIQSTLTQTGAGTWPACTFAVSDWTTTAGTFSGGCAFGIGAQPSTYTGVLMHVDFTCSASGTITLVNGLNITDLVDDALAGHSEADESTEPLTIQCGAEPPLSPTPAASPTPCDGPCPTATPVPPTPTSVPPSPTPTQVPSGPCDADGNSVINSQDALWVLWKEARIVENVPRPANADCNLDGVVNSIDALYILWTEAGRI